MPSVIGSPRRQYTPPSLYDDHSHLPLFTSNHHTSTSHHNSKSTTHSSTTSLTRLATASNRQDHSMSSPPSSPPSSDDSPTTSGGDNNTFSFQDDTEMLDYEDFPTSLGQSVLEESSPEALFFGNQNLHNQSSSRFTSNQPSPEGFSPFTTTLAGLKGNDINNNNNTSSPEFDNNEVVVVDGDSPGIGQDMRGLRINSRFPSPVLQNTVRLEDVMLPTEDLQQPATISSSGSLFENKVHVQHVETGLFQPYRLPFTFLFLHPNNLC